MTLLLRSALAGAFLCALVSATLVAAPAKEPQPPDEKAIAAVRERTAQLGAAVEKLRAKMAAKDEGSFFDKVRLADVEVFHKAAAFQLKHNQWYAPDDAKRTLAVLDRGLARAKQLEAGKTPWCTRPGSAIRAYRSEIDDSLQPYAVVLPEGYPGPNGKKWRLDVILHGRDDQLTEAKFISAHDNDNPAPRQDFVELHVFGRTCNAYRWAGERDVFEALDWFVTELAAAKHDESAETIDRRRIVLRGFSMGGAGAWHLGLHYPGKWCSVSPGAGFSTTYGPVKNKDGKLPWYEEKCLSIYEALDYAENVRAVPFVAYGGEDDPQLEAAKSIEAKLKTFGIPLTLLIGPKTQHKYHPDSLKEIMRLQGEHAAAGRSVYPEKVSFVTYYPRFGECDWLAISQLAQSYSRAVAEGEFKDGAYRIKTENVRGLFIELPEGAAASGTYKVQIDSQSITAPVSYLYPGHRQRPCLYFRKNDKQLWELTEPSKFLAIVSDKPEKTAYQPGPIDDAFTRSFLCVRGAGKPWNESTQKYATASLERFAYEWSRYFRGDLPIKNDRDLTDEDRKSKNLILFGDGGSNSEIAARLKEGFGELKWTKENIEFGGKKYGSAENVPVMIYPHDGHYIVLNSGHTFHEADFKASNRMLYPRLGDYAILNPAPTKEDPCAAAVVTAGLFDENWKLPKQP